VIANKRTAAQIQERRSQGRDAVTQLM
jgi:hypothetical protein